MMKPKIMFELAVAFLIILGSSVTSVHPVFSVGVVGPNLDLFTQKALFNGTGQNTISDAFQQQELVILYALVTFSDDPIANKIVGFQIDGPANNFQNFTITGASPTNLSGIAVFSFRIPTAVVGMEQRVFGNWSAFATVDLDEVVVNDTVTFQVGWLISISSVTTLNSQLIPQTNFARKSPIVFDLTLESIALTAKNATLTISAQDARSHPIVYIEIDNQTVLPGTSHARGSSQIPENANLGLANATCSAYTAPPSEGGIPYSPSVYTTFSIIGIGHDVAITNVTASTDQVSVGQNVEITIETANFGNVNETYDVTVYYDSKLISTIAITSLAPNSSETIEAEWNTSNVNPGTYRISANATIVEDDMNPENNNFTDGTVTIAGELPKQNTLDPYLVFLLGLIGLGVIAGLPLMLLLLASNDRPRRRKTRKKSKYMIVEHPHV